MTVLPGLQDLVGLQFILYLATIRSCGAASCVQGYSSWSPGVTAVCVPYLPVRVGSAAAGWSGVFSFTSAPHPAAVAQGRDTFTFLVFNDVGQENLGR